MINTRNIPPGCEMCKPATDGQSRYWHSQQWDHAPVEMNNDYGSLCPWCVWIDFLVVAFGMWTSQTHMIHGTGGIFLPTWMVDVYHVNVGKDALIRWEMANSLLLGFWNPFCTAQKWGPGSESKERSSGELEENTFLNEWLWSGENHDVYIWINT